MIVTLILFVLFLNVYFWLKKRENFWKERNFPSATFEFPFGSMNGVGTKIPFCIGLDEFYKKFKHKGPAVGFFSFTNPVLLPIDPSLIKHILVTDFDSFHDRALYYNKRDDPISGHLLALQGREWKERRAMLTPTFTSGKMKIMFEIIDIIGEELVKSMKNSIQNEVNDLEMHEIVSQFTTDAISNVAFGMDSNSLNNPNSSMRKHGKEILNFGISGFLKFLFTLSFPDLSRKLHLTANKRCVIDFFYNTFKANIEHRENNNVYRKDFLQILLELKRKHTLTVEELAAESFIFFLGGFETSSSLMTFVLYELALNKDVQDKLRKEIVEAMEKGAGKLSYDTIFELKYLDMVINETMRKFPPAFIIFRKCTKDFKIPGTEMIIPKNADININIYSLHNDPEYFPNPEKFDPERFSAENTPLIVPFSYIPFGGGQRSCIGRRFGLMQSKIGIIKLIQNFEFSVCDKTSIPLKFLEPTLFLTPLNKMWLKVSKINHQ